MKRELVWRQPRFARLSALGPGGLAHRRERDELRFWLSVIDQLAAVAEKDLVERVGALLAADAQTSPGMAA